MFFRWRLDHEKHHETGNRGEPDPTPGEPECRDITGHAQHRTQHGRGTIFGGLKDRIASIVVDGGNGVDLVGGEDLGDIVVYHGFETILRLFEEAGGSGRSDHGPQKTTKDEDFK